MPSARRRIAIIITTLVMGALPAMLPAAILFLGAQDDPGIGAGLIALVSWVLIGAALIAMLTPLFTDMRIRVRSALRTSALGLVAGLVVGWPLGIITHPTAGIVIGLIAGTAVAQRDLGRQLGAVPGGLRDDLRAVVARVTSLRAPADDDAPPTLTPVAHPTTRSAETPITAMASPTLAPLADDPEIGRRRGDG